jgi:alpha-1,2-mannosyltransferase
METDDGVCRAPDGTPKLTFGLASRRGMLTVFILACLPLASILIVPRLFLFVGGRLGSHLRKRAAGRRTQILKRTEDDEMAYLVPEEARRNSDDWEDVDAYTTGTAKNGEKADPEWDGIVGFFHPFW